MMSQILSFKILTVNLFTEYINKSVVQIESDLVLDKYFYKLNPLSYFSID